MSIVFYIITVESIVDVGFSEGKPLFPVGAIIFTITANASARSQQEYVSYGFDAYMAKPIEMNILEELLITYLPEEKIEKA